jgi:hypothetical protein
VTEEEEEEASGIFLLLYYALKCAKSDRGRKGELRDGEE